MAVIDSLRKCPACGQYHWTSEWPENHTWEGPNRSDLAAPMVISDSQDAVKSMADGKVYESKSAMRRSYRADGNPQGVEFTEVGNDPGRFKPKPKPKIDEQAITDSLGKSIAQAKSANVI